MDLSPRPSDRASNRIPRTRAPASELIGSTRQDRADMPRSSRSAPHTPRDSTIYVVIHSFYYIVSHFTIMNWAILQEWTKPFFHCYSAHPVQVIRCSAIPCAIVLSHFSKLIHFHYYNVNHSSCHSAKLFFIATLLSHFPLLITQLFFITTMLNHFHCYSAQPFPTIKGCSVILRYYSTQPFLLQYSVIFSELSHSSYYSA
jgi:hypothetical protein